MHDLSYFRDHLDLFADMARKRNISLDLDTFTTFDRERRELITQTEQLKAKRNKASDEIARLKKEKQDATAILADMAGVSKQIKEADERIANLDNIQRDMLLGIPNVPHSSVPVGKGAEDNVEVRRWGTPPTFDFAPKPHWEVGENAGILDLPAATKITGARFAVYKSWGARLERALANFFLDVHTREHGYTEILPPFLVNTASLLGSGQLPKFAADLFKIADTDFWLTPTSEVELHNMHRDETLSEDALPINVTAWTACFRSEAGAAGKDTRGILRQHQFQKVELFKFTKPDQSYAEHEKLVADAESILQKLGLHYRTMLLCTGDMGFASAKTYDIEVWLPSANEFAKFPVAQIANPFRRAAPASATNPRPAASPTSSIPSTVADWRSAAPGSPWWKTISKRTVPSSFQRLCAPTWASTASRLVLNRRVASYGEAGPKAALSWPRRLVRLSKRIIMSGLQRQPQATHRSFGKSGKHGMDTYVAQLVESTPFRLTRPFRVAYTRLTAPSGVAAPFRAACNQTDRRT